MDEFWRDARNGGYFSYLLNTNNELNLSLMVRYWGNEGGYRTFDILIDNEKLVTENITGKWNVSEFRNVEYPIPNSMINGKTNIRVKFQAPASGYAGGAFYIRLLRQVATDAMESNINNAVEAMIWSSDKMIRISGLIDKALVNIFDLSGRLIKCGSFESQNVNIPVNPGVYMVNILTGNKDIITGKVVIN